MLDLNLLWQDVCAELVSDMTAVAYTIWIENLKPLCIKDNNLIVVCPSSSSKKTINKVYKTKITRALYVTKTNLMDVTFIVDEEKEEYLDKMEDFFDNEIVINTPPTVNTRVFLPRYTFDNFVVGESNKLAFHASETVAQKPGSKDGYLNFNPLFIYGGVGLGKTHLLHSIGNYLTDNRPSLNILYVPTEKLTNDFIDSLSNNATNKNSFQQFREKYRTVDVLMLDDVQFLQKKAGLQDVVFHIFNELYQNNKQIILSSDRPPKEIGTLEDRLRSRFEGGLLVDVGQPNLEMRVAIIRKKMLLEKVAVNDEVVYFLAEKIDSNIRELEGALSKVILYSQLINKPYPDIDTAREALRVTESNPKQGIDSTDIINSVCSYFRVNKNDIIGKKKTKDIVEARMIAIYIVTDLLSLPLVTIGQIFGGRDHTTIIHSRDKIMNSLEKDKDIQRYIKDIMGLLKSSDR